MPHAATIVAVSRNVPRRITSGVVHRRPFAGDALVSM